MRGGRHDEAQRAKLPQERLSRGERPASAQMRDNALKYEHARDETKDYLVAVILVEQCIIPLMALLYREQPPDWWRRQGGRCPGRGD